ncbi:MAG: two-component system LytT family response regulator [Marinoscillum sp.]|jgi:two-component system LytT family response regulator
MKAIAIDDDPLMIMTIEKIVSKSKSVELVSGYGDAIKGAEGILAEEPDIIFLDIDMPEMNGFDLMKSLQNPPHIIVVSSDDNHRQLALDLNAIAFFKKPINQELFLTFLDNLSSNVDTTFA